MEEDWRWKIGNSKGFQMYRSYESLWLSPDFSLKHKSKSHVFIIARKIQKQRVVQACPA